MVLKGLSSATDPTGPGDPLGSQGMTINYEQLQRRELDRLRGMDEEEIMEHHDCGDVEEFDFDP
jgi:hypothetical protein